MPDSKRMDSYPTVFLEYLTYVIDHPDEQLRFPCRTKSEALSLRSRIGAFRAAYEREVTDHPLPLFSVGLYLEPPNGKKDEPTTLVFRHRDNHELAERMRRAFKPEKLPG